MPNWFGAQRFGHAARALRDGERFISLHKKAISRREQFWVSALQSALWNAWLASRVEEDTWVTALDGDVLMKRDTGAPFICTDPAHDGPRCEAGEVSPSGPMYGRAMRCAERDALTQESRSLDRLGVSLATMLAHPAFATGTRRPSRVFAGEMKSHLDGAQLTVTFTLGPGSYASVFLEELVGARLVDRFFSDAAAGPDDA
jgi:tRNA pseudouridine13 synthase